jgi:hypothetical protein
MWIIQSTARKEGATKTHGSFGVGPLLYRCPAGTEGVEPTSSSYGYPLRRQDRYVPKKFRKSDFYYYRDIVGMKPLFDPSTIKELPAKKKLPFECEKCSITFYVERKRFQDALKSHPGRHKFCSKTCQTQAQVTVLSMSCTHCGEVTQRRSSQHKHSKSGNVFCSSSCAAKYNNAHKTMGCRRSKLEQWLEQALTTHYPNLQFVFNGKETINSELDIYIPSLQLAVELNGIFHYEPIYGPEKLASIQNNDGRKFQACCEAGISLAIIDVSSMKHFKPKGAQRYFEIIKNIIDDIKT